MTHQHSPRTTGPLPAASQEILDPRHAINRELSSLAFQRRVLSMALDPAVPLLERLRFVTITCANLDEFFEIRVSRLQRQVELGLTASGTDGLPPNETLNRIHEEARAIVAEQYRIWSEVLLPELATAGIRLLQSEEWTSDQKCWVETYFRREVVPVLTPIGLDPAHPFPHVQNKNQNLLVSLTGQDAFGRQSGIAIVQVPRSLPRVLAIPGTKAGVHAFVLLSTVIQACVGELFPGMAVTNVVSFRVTRDADLWLAEEDADDLLEALQGELHRRRYGDAVRLEVAGHCPDAMAEFLLGEFELDPIDLYRVAGPVNLHRVGAILDMCDRPELRYPPYTPRLPRGWQDEDDRFEWLRRADLLLHHPYEAAAPVLEFLRQAADDPDVLAIKQTLYRTGPRSPYVEALAQAARNGKDVTAVVELRARFDEAANIDLAAQLQKAGANVVYGVVGYKTHAKMLLVVRREGDGIRRYVHLGTGNYHPQTARTYTDLGLLTSDPVIGEDVHKVFLQLTGLGTPRKLERLLESPFTLGREVIARIDAQAARARAGLPARIQAKMNALSEPNVIAALYRASQAGVPIDLLVRGICCLRPGMPGVSETIRVRSIVGRFLEHARVWCFGEGDDAEVWFASADWMSRSFSRRVEVATPVRNADLRARIVEECLAQPLRDNVQAWLLAVDGTYTRATPGDEIAFGVQDWLAGRGES